MPSFLATPKELLALYGRTVAEIKKHALAGLIPYCHFHDAATLPIWIRFSPLYSSPDPAEAHSQIAGCSRHGRTCMEVTPSFVERYSPAWRLETLS